MAQKQPGKVMHLRIPDELHAALHELADQESRTLNATAILLFREAFKARGITVLEPGTRPRDRWHHLRGAK